MRNVMCLVVAMLCVSLMGSFAAAETIGADQFYTAPNTAAESFDVSTPVADSGDFFVSFQSAEPIQAPVVDGDFGTVEKPADTPIQVPVETATTCAVSMPRTAGACSSGSCGSLPKGSSAVVYAVASGHGDHSYRSAPVRRGLFGRERRGLFRGGRVFGRLRGGC